MPEAGTIESLSVYFSGRGGGCTSKLCLWNSAGTLVAQSAQFTAAQGSDGIGNQAWQTRALTTPYSASSGQSLFVGFAHDPAQDAVWSYDSRAGVHHRHHDIGASWPGNLAGTDHTDRTLGAYVTYTTGLQVYVRKSGGWQLCTVYVRKSSGWVPVQLAVRKSGGWHP